MAIKLTETQLRNEVDVTFNDNFNGTITAANVRAFINKLIDNIVPEISGLVISENKSMSLTSTPIKIANYSSAVNIRDSLVADAVEGNVTVNSGGIVALSGRFGVIIPINKIVTVEVYIDGVPSGLPIIKTGNGSNDNIQFAFPFGVRDQLTGAVVDVRIKSDSATDVTIVGGFVELERINLGKV